MSQPQTVTEKPAHESIPDAIETAAAHVCAPNAPASTHLERLTSLEGLLNLLKATKVPNKHKADLVKRLQKIKNHPLFRVDGLASLFEEVIKQKKPPETEASGDAQASN